MSLMKICYKCGGRVEAGAQPWHSPGLDGANAGGNELGSGEGEGSVEEAHDLGRSRLRVHATPEGGNQGTKYPPALAAHPLSLPPSLPLISG